MEKTWKCLIIDDDPISQKLLSHLVEQQDILSLAGVCSSAKEAFSFLNTHKVDLLLLDVEMPEITGLQFLQTLPIAIPVIIVSGRAVHAVSAFEMEVVDFLLKPVSELRFMKALQRLSREDRSQGESRGVPIPTPAHLFLKDSGQWERVLLGDIHWVEAKGDYVKVSTTHKNYMVHIPLKQLESELPGDRFMRVHRSFLVRLGGIETLEDNTLSITGKLIPIGKSYRKALLERLSLVGKPN